MGRIQAHPATERAILLTLAVLAAVTGSASATATTTYVPSKARHCRAGACNYGVCKSCPTNVVIAAQQSIVGNVGGNDALKLSPTGAIVPGDLVVDGSITVRGNATININAAPPTNLNLPGTLTVGGATTLSSTLSVSGVSSLGQTEWAGLTLFTGKQPYECGITTAYDMTIGGLSSPTRYTQIVCVNVGGTWAWYRFGGTAQPDLEAGTSTLYENCAPPQNTGRVAALRIGDYDANALKAVGLYGFISSFSLPANTQITMYKTDDFTGTSLTVTGPGIFSFATSVCTLATQVGDMSWNDQVDSLKVTYVP